MNYEVIFKRMLIQSTRPNHILVSHTPGFPVQSVLNLEFFPGMAEMFFNELTECLFLIEDERLLGNEEKGINGKKGNKREKEKLFPNM